MTARHAPFLLTAIKCRGLSREVAHVSLQQFNALLRQDSLPGDGIEMHWENYDVPLLAGLDKVWH